MPTIPFPPPAPTLGAALAYGIAGASGLLGLALLIWGRLVHRGFLVILAAGVGFALGRGLAPRIGLDPLLGGLGAAVTLGMLALMLARLVWAVVAGLLAAAAAAGAAVVHYWPAVASQPAAEIQQADLGQYVSSLARFAWTALGVSAGHSALVVAAAAATGVGLLAVGILLPRATAIFMSSLVGASLVVSGAALAAGQARPDLWTAALGDVRWPALATGGLLLGGILAQTVAALRAGKHDEGTAADKEDAQED